MSPMEPDDLEAELQRFKPAKPSNDFLGRLSAALSDKPALRPVYGVRRSVFERWRVLLRWLAPTTICVFVFLALLFWKPGPSGTKPSRPELAQSMNSALTADKVEIDRQLVAAFDAVAQLPDGKPVRLRCQEWVDQVVLQDSAKGVVVEQKIPHLEVVPVGFETY